MNNLLHWNAPAVKKLLGWRMSDDEEKWAEKAIEALVKKMKKRNGNGVGTIEDLEYALANPGRPSSCVTIPKSLDGRLQVSHKKGLPHVIYCKVWRWPDLQSHQELRPIKECRYPHDTNSNHQQVCINPYHYIKLEHSRPYSNYSSSFSSPQPIPSPDSFSVSTCSPTPIQMGSCSTSPNGSDYGAASPSVFSEDGDNQSRQIPSPVIQMMPQVPNYWGSISYYELNSRVGEVFKMWQKVVTVDGFTDPSNAESRMCLGLLSNVNRNVMIENTRKHIGRGVRLEYTHENNLIITNLSETPVFVQSRNCNLAMNQQLTAVCRVPPGAAIRAFDHRLFYEILCQKRQGGSINQLHELNAMCYIRMSFVKGWGPDYPRQDVTSTPCWVEVTLNLPLAWIDQTIPQAQPPSGDPTSVS